MRYGVSSSISCGRLMPRVRRVISRTCVLNLSRAFGAMRRSLPSFEMLNPRNLRSSGCATALFASLTFSQPQLLGQEPADRGHHPLAGAAAANIDVAVVRVTAEAVPPPGQFLVEIVEHEVAQERRERTAPCLRRGRLCGVPSSTGLTRPSSITPDLRNARMSLSTRLSVTRAAMRAIKLS